MAPTSGILYVTMQPKDDLPLARFHDWYNNEHGPGRLRLPFVENGFRYRATDLEGPGKGMPEWMAIYDIADMDELTREPYISLRKAPVQSQRERETMKQIAVDRKFFDYVEGRQSKDFKRLEEINAGKENVLVSVSLIPLPGKGPELTRWYREEHVDMLSKVPGWLRTRRFVTASIEGKNEVEYLSLHDYAPQNGLNGKEFKAAISTPWAKEVRSSLVKERKRRVYDLYYTFGPAPRDLKSLLSNDTVPFSSTDGQTRISPAAAGTISGAIESYITTKDGVTLPYRLEGSSDSEAPLIVLSNSILVEWGIWDDFVDSFFSKSENKKYRILRYHTRGRSSKYGAQPISVDLLASDLITLLDALRVPRAGALIGVSLGGATVLDAALKHPERVGTFISCDTNAKSPAGNSKVWIERIAVAEKGGTKDTSGDKIVGEELAELTVRRWFVKESYDGGLKEESIKKVKTMVENNSLGGFKKSVEALYEYDFKEEMKNCSVRGAFLVGSGDGVLPGTMKEMAADYGNGTECFVINGAGHLPMVEKPKEFSEVVSKFLAS